MNTIVVTMPDAMAREVAKGADALGISHDEFGFRAVNILLRSMFGARRGRPYLHNPEAADEAAAEAPEARMKETRKQKIARQQRHAAGRAADRAFDLIRAAMDDGRLTITPGRDVTPAPSYQPPPTTSWPEFEVHR